MDTPQKVLKQFRKLARKLDCFCSFFIPTFCNKTTSVGNVIWPFFGGIVGTHNGLEKFKKVVYLQTKYIVIFNQSTINKCSEIKKEIKIKASKVLDKEHVLQS